MKNFHFISPHKVPSVFSLVVITLSFFVVVAIILLRNVERADAQVSSFFPTSCLGGWKNTEGAMGAPEVIDGDAEKYNQNNSALLENSVAQIFCGGFEGEIPADALQKKIVLKFSWAIKNSDPTVDIPTETSEESEEEIILPAEASPEIISEEETEESVNETILEESPEEITPTEESVEESAPVEESPAEEPSTEPAPEPAPEQSFLDILIPKVYAEDIDAIDRGEESPAETADENITETTTLPETSPEVLYTLDENDLNPVGFLEVLYTLDGNNWSTIGYVSDISNDVFFEMPMDIFTSIEDLARVQIAIQPLPTFDNMPAIYLDSVWLEVEYENLPEIDELSQVATVAESVDDSLSEEDVNEEIEENVMEEVVEEEIVAEEVIEEILEVVEEELLVEETIEEEIITELIPNPVEMPPPPPWPPLSVREYDKKIIIDPTALHNCEARPITIDISGVKIYIIPLFLETSAQGFYELEIGGLPDGVDVTFSKNDGYSYQVRAGETEVDLKIENETGSRKGNFSIIAIFTKKGATDSSVTCQINVVNK